MSTPPPPQPAEDLVALIAELLRDATDEIVGCAGASVLVTRGPAVFTAASTAPWVAEVDASQIEQNNGPSLSAGRVGRYVRLDPIVAGPGTYERFRRTAAAAGILGVIAAPYRIDRRAHGAVSLYSRAPRPFDDFAAGAAARLAALVGHALSGGRSSDLAGDLSGDADRSGAG